MAFDPKKMDQMAFGEMIGTRKRNQIHQLFWVSEVAVTLYYNISESRPPSARFKKVNKKNIPFSERLVVLGNY